MSGKLTVEQTQQRINNIEEELKGLLWPGEEPIQFSEDPTTRKIQQVVLVYSLKTMKTAYRYEEDLDAEGNEDAKKRRLEAYRNFVKNVESGEHKLVAFAIKHPELREGYIKDLVMADDQSAYYDSIASDLDPGNKYAFSEDVDTRTVQQAVLLYRLSQNNAKRRKDPSRLSEQELVNKFFSEADPLIEYILSDKDLLAEVSEPPCYDTSAREKVGRIAKEFQFETVLNDVGAVLNPLLGPAARQAEFSSDPETRQLQQMMVYYRLNTNSATLSSNDTDQDKITDKINKQNSIIQNVLSGNDALYNYIENHPNARRQYLTDLFNINQNLKPLEQIVNNSQKTGIQDYLDRKAKYDQGLFAPEVSADYHYPDQVSKRDDFIALQQKNSQIKLEVPEGLSEQDVSTLVFACTIDRSSILKAHEVMQKQNANNKSAGTADKMNNTDYENTIDTLFNGIYHEGSSQRENQHCIRFVVPAARERSKDILESYKQGDKKAMGGVLCQALRNTIEYCVESDNASYGSYAAAVQSIDQLVFVLSRDEFKEFNTLTASEKEMIGIVRARYENQKTIERLSREINAQILDLNAERLAPGGNNAAGNNTVNDHEDLKTKLRDLYRAQWIASQNLVEAQNYSYSVKNPSIDHEFCYKVKTHRVPSLYEQVLLSASKPEEEQTAYDKELIETAYKHIDETVFGSDSYNELLNCSFDNLSTIESKVGKVSKMVSQETPLSNHYNAYDLMDGYLMPAATEDLLRDLDAGIIKPTNMTKKESDKLRNEIKNLVASDKHLRKHPTLDEIKNRINEYQAMKDKLEGIDFSCTDPNIDPKTNGSVGMYINALGDPIKYYKQGRDENLNRTEFGKRMDNLLLKGKLLAMVNSNDHEYTFLKNGEAIDKEKVVEELAKGSKIKMQAFPKGQSVGIRSNLQIVDGHFSGSRPVPIEKVPEGIKDLKGAVYSREQFNKMLALHHELDDSMDIRDWSKLQKAMNVGVGLLNNINKDKFDYKYFQDGKEINFDQAFEAIATGKKVSAHVFEKGKPFGAIVDFYRDGSGKFVKEKTNELCARYTDIKNSQTVTRNLKGQADTLKTFQYWLKTTDPWFVKNSKQFNDTMNILDKVVEAHKIFGNKPNVQQAQSLEVLYKDLNEACQAYEDVKDPKLQDDPKDERGSMRLDLIKSLKTMTQKSYVRDVFKNTLTKENAEKLAADENALDVVLKENVIGKVSRSFKELADNEALRGPDKSRTNVDNVRQECIEAINTLYKSVVSKDKTGFMMAHLSNDLGKLCKQVESFNKAHPEGKLLPTYVKALNDYGKKFDQAHKKLEKMPEAQVKKAQEARDRQNLPKLEDFLF